jgi:hypothetical protein
LLAWLNESLPRASDARMLECVHSAEHLIKVRIDAPETESDLVLFEALLEDVQGHIRKHCL